MNPITRKVGRITVAVSLVAVGLALLIDNLFSTAAATGLIAKFWPLMLIGIGLEYLVFTAISQRTGEEVRLRFDGGGTFLLVLVMLLAFGIHTVRTWNWQFPFGGDIRVEVADGEQREEARTVSATGVQEIQVDINVGSVRVTENSRNDEIRIEARYSTGVGILVRSGDLRHHLDSIKLNVAEGGGVVRITPEYTGSLSDISIRYVIYAPPGIKINADTGAGPIDIAGYKGDLDLTSRVGRITVENGAGRLSAVTNSGYVSVRNFAGPVTARATVGSLSVQNVIGALQLDSGTGAINVNGFQGGTLVAETRTGAIQASTVAPLEGDVILKTQTGAVNLSVPKESSARIMAQTRTGGISRPGFMVISGAGPSKTATGTLGDGKYSVSLEASTGAVNFSVR